VSPILHDYKPATGSQVKKFTAVHWFAVGLGLPLIGIALLLTLKNASGTNTAVIQSDVEVAMAEQDVALAVAIVDIAQDEPVAELAAEPIPFPPFHPPLMLPPEYDQLSFTIKRGDTLNALFRRNKLDLAYLAMILRLPEAAPHLTRLIPGDEFLIEKARFRENRDVTVRKRGRGGTAGYIDHEPGRNFRLGRGLCPGHPGWR
jgi:hypothetical protein